VGSALAVSLDISRRKKELIRLGEMFREKCRLT